MWNTFDNCKDTIMQIGLGDNFRNGLTDEQLKTAVQEVFDKYKDKSFSKAKSEAIAFVLKEGAIDFVPEDIFGCRINRSDIMEDLFCQIKTQIVCNSGFKKTEYDKYNPFNANTDFGHIAPDWQYILDNGITGIIADLEFYKEKNTDKQAYYDERITVYNAIIDLFYRFAEMADGYNTKKTEFIAANLRKLAVSAPETMAEAMQLILLFYTLQTKVDMVFIRSLGGIDRMLYPFYKSDLESGRFTKDQLAEIVKYFFWNISSMKVGANVPFYICGLDENGKDATNEFTRFILDIYRELDIYDPKMHVMYHENINQDVLDLILDMIREGKNSFVFMNTELISRSLEKIGVSHEDAKKVIIYGCYEAAAEGTEIPCTCGGMVNLVKSIEITIKQAKVYNTFDDFYCEVLQHLENYTTACMDEIAFFEQHYEQICPSMFMSPTFKNSRESGIDLYAGGAKYNNTSIVGVGLATLVDSIVAVKNVVFEEKIKSLEELRTILDANWQGNEKLRLLIKKKYSKFGNNADEADKLAVDIYNRFSSLINGRKNGRGGVFRCGMFSVDERHMMGEKTPATPDGRFSGDSLSKNLTASLGQDKNGVTAYLNSVLKLDAEECSDGYVADVVLHCSAVKGEDGHKAFKGLLTTFMQKGGFSVHFNILSPEMLHNAQKEPEKYLNLQIRLCGWNVRFVDLNKAQQDEFILQSENVM